jgi:hypothetical protein
LISGRKLRVRGRDSSEPDRLVVRCVKTLLGNNRGRSYRSVASECEQRDTLDHLEDANASHGADMERDGAVTEHSEPGPGNGSGS